MDGRYEKETSPLRDFFSEFAYLRSRARLELDFLAGLSNLGILPADSLSGYKPGLQNFTDEDALKIQEYEKTTRHDVKAIEYFLREKLPAKLHSFIHIGLTSEDVNNLALALALRDSRDRVLLPAFDNLLAALKDFAKKYRAAPMLARISRSARRADHVGKGNCRISLALDEMQGRVGGSQVRGEIERRGRQLQRPSCRLSKH